MARFEVQNPCGVKKKACAQKIIQDFQPCCKLDFALGQQVLSPELSPKTTALVNNLQKTKGQRKSQDQPHCFTHGAYFATGDALYDY